jgi:hypothetical protein
MLTIFHLTSFNIALLASYAINKTIHFSWAVVHLVVFGMCQNHNYFIPYTNPCNIWNSCCHLLFGDVPLGEVQCQVCDG